MHKRPLAVICIFFIIGIVLARYLPVSVKFPHIFILTLILILSAFIFSLIDSRFRGNDKAENIFLLLSVTSFAALLYMNSNIFPGNHISHILKEEKLKTDIVGIIKSPALTRRPYYGKINSTHLFEIEAIKDKGEWWRVKGTGQIRIQTEKDYRYGDRLLVRGILKKPALPKKEDDFNYREYLERQNIFAIINTKEHNVTVLSKNYNSNPVLAYIYSIRERVKGQILEKMPLESGAFLRAILLGDRSELPKHIQTSFRNSGTMHILAISGLHVGIIALMWLYGFRFVRVNREVSYALTLILLITFALLTLSRSSVVRAVIMAGVFLIGMLLGRRVDVYNSLGAAALFLLIKNPKDLFNVSFQLSFLAVLAIVCLAPRFMKMVDKIPIFFIKRYVFMPLSVSTAAWVGTFPLILYYFKIITPIAIIANLFIIPLLFIMLIGALVFILLGWIPYLGTVIANFNNILISLIFYLSDFFSSLKFSHFCL